MTSFAAPDAVRLSAHWADADDRAPAAQVEWRPTLEGAYRALAPSVLGYFRSYGLAIAEDLTGDVFVSVAKGLRRFRGDEHDLRRWVFSIARRRLVDHFRRRRVRSIVTLGDLPERGVHVDMGDLDVDLVAALKELTEPQREVIVLRFVADLPLEDVARLVERTVGSVKALQSRALAQLEQMLEPRFAASVG